MADKKYEKPQGKYFLEDETGTMHEGSNPGEVLTPENLGVPKSRLGRLLDKYLK